jgi:murein DD-endopeptidase MepM/ murein hydrolase activator NlpD
MREGLLLDRSDTQARLLAPRSNPSLGGVTFDPVRDNSGADYQNRTSQIIELRSSLGQLSGITSDRNTGRDVFGFGLSDYVPFVGATRNAINDFERFPATKDAYLTNVQQGVTVDKLSDDVARVIEIARLEARSSLYVARLHANSKIASAYNLPWVTDEYLKPYEQEFNRQILNVKQALAQKYAPYGAAATVMKEIDISNIANPGTWRALGKHFFTGATALKSKVFDPLLRGSLLADPNSPNINYGQMLDFKDWKITSDFGPRQDPIPVWDPIQKRYVPSNSTTQHMGIDIDRNEGDDIVSIFDGEIIETESDPTLGNYVTMRDSVTGVYSQHGHMANGSILVTPGMRVKKGERIGKAGKTGRATGIHEHLAIIVPTNDGRFFFVDPSGRSQLRYPVGSKTSERLRQDRERR